jgi:23S rRNA (adenine2503-C2)-methyltransferase
MDAVKEERIRSIHDGMMAALFSPRLRPMVRLRLFLLLVVAQLPTAIEGWTTALLRPSWRSKSRRTPKSLFFAEASYSPVSSAAVAQSSPLSLTFEQLSDVLQGRGMAQVVWDGFRSGRDPFFYTSIDGSPSNRATKLYQHLFRGPLEETVAAVVDEQTIVCHDDSTTTKLLLELTDGCLLETTVITRFDRLATGTTVCVSCQVDCRSAFGGLRNLSQDEILAQVWAAVRFTRYHRLPVVDTVVFAGNGEPADNAAAVVRATDILTDPRQFALPPRSVTIYTVAPTPQAFQHLEQAPAILVWTVHSSIDEIRRQLVPTHTRHSMLELRQALRNMLRSRTRRLREVVLEVTLVEGVNDLPEHGAHLVQFCRPLLSAPGCKLVVNKGQAYVVGPVTAQPPF